MDSTDHALLQLLNQDGRRPAAELARALGVSRATVQNRIDKLTSDGTILRFTIERGAKAQAAVVDALVLACVTAGDNRKTIDQLRRLPAVISLATANGRYDIVMELQTASLNHLDEVLMQIRRMPMIQDTNSIIRLKRFK